MDSRDQKAGICQDYFTGQAQLYLIEMLLRRINKKQYHRKQHDRNIKILSIGCGDGNELSVLSKQGIVDILDIDKKVVKQIPKKMYSKLIISDITKFKTQKKYDIIVGFDVLEHVKDDVKAMHNIYDSMKPSGYFIFTVPAHQNLFSAHDKALHHFRRYDKKELKDKLQKYFSISFLSYRYFFIYPVVLVSKLLNKNKSPKIEAPRLPRFINNLLVWLLRIEIFMMQKFSLPIGISLVGICKKKDKV